MDENTIVVAKIKAQLSKFSGIISKGFTKAKRRLIKEILYGIQATKDVKLSNISRSLNEQQPLIKTEDRLSRNLNDVDFTDGINREICRLGAPKVLEEMVMAIDLGDIRKKFARKMEYLGGIRDGSERKVGNGYWLYKCLAADIEHTWVIPLYCEAYSQESRGFLSENEQLFRAIDVVSRHIGRRGIWAIDRGRDRGILLRGLLKRKVRFVVRLVGKRNLVLKDGTKKKALKVA